jgi:hypothetical protein
MMSILSSGVYAQSDITPYGVSCPRCGEYGYCKKPLTYQEAVKAFKSYYEEKGFKVVTTEHRGRFIEADIYRDEKIVDKVILDRKTGRIRSIY